jgi:hypothetical protein
MSSNADGAPPAAPTTMPPPLKSGGATLRRSPSLQNTAQEDGLRRALEIVRAQGDFYKREQGLSPLSFTVGLLNVGLSGFALGRRPEYYWVGLAALITLCCTENTRYVPVTNRTSWSANQNTR